MVTGRKKQRKPWLRMLETATAGTFRKASNFQSSKYGDQQLLHSKIVHVLAQGYQNNTNPSSDNLWVASIGACVGSISSRKSVHRPNVCHLKIFRAEITYAGPSRKHVGVALERKLMGDQVYAEKCSSD